MYTRPLRRFILSSVHHVPLSTTPKRATAAANRVRVLKHGGPTRLQSTSTPGHETSRSPEDVSPSKAQTEAQPAGLKSGLHNEGADPEASEPLIKPQASGHHADGEQPALLEEEAELSLRSPDMTNAKVSGYERLHPPSDEHPQVSLATEVADPEATLPLTNSPSSLGALPGDERPALLSEEAHIEFDPTFLPPPSLQSDSHVREAWSSSPNSTLPESEQPDPELIDPTTTPAPESPTDPSASASPPSTSAQDIHPPLPPVPEPAPPLAVPSDAYVEAFLVPLYARGWRVHARDDKTRDRYMVRHLEFSTNGAMSKAIRELHAIADGLSYSTPSSAPTLDGKECHGESEDRKYQPAIEWNETTLTITLATYDPDPSALRVLSAKQLSSLNARAELLSRRRHAITFVDVRVAILVEQLIAPYAIAQRHLPAGAKSVPGWMPTRAAEVLGTTALSNGPETPKRERAGQGGAARHAGYKCPICEEGNHRVAKCPERWTKPPTQPCPRCGGDHWKVNCLSKLGKEGAASWQQSEEGILDGKNDDQKRSRHCAICEGGDHSMARCPERWTKLPKHPCPKCDGDHWVINCTELHAPRLPVVRGTNLESQLIQHKYHLGRGPRVPAHRRPLLPQHVSAEAAQQDAQQLPLPHPVSIRGELGDVLNRGAFLKRQPHPASSSRTAGLNSVEPREMEGGTGDRKDRKR